MIVRGRVALTFCRAGLDSVTAKVSDAPETAAVGVPEINPVDAERLKPAGGAPASIDHESGAVPPVAERVAE